MAKEMNLNLGINTSDGFTAANGTRVSYQDIFDGVLTNVNCFASRGGTGLTREDIQDLAQDAFLRAVLYHDSFKPELSRKPQDFGNRIAENCKKDAFTRAGKHLAAFTSMEAGDEDGEEFIPRGIAGYRGDEFEADRNLERKELEDRVSRAIDTLGETSQTIVSLSLQGYKTSAIAKRLGLDLRTTYTRLSRAKAALRKALGNARLPAA